MTATEYGLRDNRSKCYKLVEGFPTIRVDRRGASAQEQYIIDTAWRSSTDKDLPRSRTYTPQELIEECFPRPQFVATISRDNPWLFIDDADNYWPRALPGAEVFFKKTGELRATRLLIEPLSPHLPADPFEADRENPQHYQTCYRATINYDSYHDCFTHEITGSGQFLSFDSHNTRVADLDTEEIQSWSLDQTEVNEAQQMQSLQLRQIVEHTLRWPRLFGPRFKEINKQLGKVNSTVFRLLDDAPKNTVLFMGYSANRIEHAVDRGTEWFEWPLYDFSLHFSQLMTEEDENIYGWNFVYSPTHEKYIYITSGETNNPAYKRYNFQGALDGFPYVKPFLANRA